MINEASVYDIVVSLIESKKEAKIGVLNKNGIATQRNW